ncbi:FMN-linked oxidoreductase [Calocera viscosa TUFC12733]|uniref:FMN-linked oxidoreductase n=1 Tax=Calocera viscosa (strain TUFC12733) TaxID=1330018 RepID=A0A167H6S6_CALVF|nr:FMN-linked oxidoreductase [Calocera viscosa TUFC12733]
MVGEQDALRQQDGRPDPPLRPSPHYDLYHRSIFKAGSYGSLPPFSTEYQIVPRMLVPTLTRDISTTLFRHHIAVSICFAPIGVNGIYHPDGELIVAKVAGEPGLQYCLSTASSRAVEDVAAVNGAWEIGRRADSTRSIMTVDTDHLAWRHGDMAEANYAFYYGIGNEMGWSGSVFRKYLEGKGIDPETDPQSAGRPWIDTVWHGKAHSWADLPRVIRLWKDISEMQSARDAILAKEHWCDGIVVSNHARWQVHGAVGSLEVLPEIVDAVGGIYRTGADVFKALALGARAVLVGRLWIFDLSIQGEHGVGHFDMLMDVAGYWCLGEVDRAALRVRGLPML